jgi:predicted metal-dependent phosphoesterase TrpH
MKIDLHVHVKRTSRCAKEDIEPMAQKLKELGITGMVALDHNYQTTKEECSLAEKAVGGMRIFRGTEVNVYDEDVVIISDQTMDFLPPYKSSLTDLDKLQKWVDDTDSLTILAHPFRWHDDISFDLKKFRPHAIEIASRHVNLINRFRILKVAKDNNMLLVSTSDAHKSRQLGGFCVDLDNFASDEKNLIKEIKSGKYTLMEKVLCPIAGIERGNVRE